MRKQILYKLWDEEHGKDNHAELWLRFAEGIGVSREDVQSAEPNEEARSQMGGILSVFGKAGSR